MSVKARVVETSNEIRNQFCSGCLKSRATGARKLVQIRMRTDGCVFDIFMCRNCAKELKEELQKVVDG